MAAPRPNGNTRTKQDVEFTKTDTVLKTRETFAKNEQQYEAKEAAAIAPDAGMDLVNLAVRRGHTMTTEQLAQKLKAINPAFVVRVSKSMPQRCNIFMPVWEKNPMTGGWKSELQHITSCENTQHLDNAGEMPEFSIASDVEEMVPGENGERKVRKFDLEVKRGWRTVVVRLLQRGVITVHDVQTHFGIKLSHDSAKWNQILNPPLVTASTETIQ